MPDAITSIHLGNRRRKLHFLLPRRRSDSGRAGVARRVESGLDAATLRARGVHREVRPAVRTAARRARRAARLTTSWRSWLGRRHAGDVSAQQPLGGRRQPAGGAVLRLGRPRGDRHRQPGERRGSQPVRGNGGRFAPLGPGIPARAILESATRIGAEALGFGADYGTIEPGKRAALIAVRVPERRGRCGRISAERHQSGRHSVARCRNR